MRILSYNINGFKAFNLNGKLFDLFNDYPSDIYCFQETKHHPTTVDTSLLSKSLFINDTATIVDSINNIKKGYAGVMTIFGSEVNKRFVQYYDKSFDYKGDQTYTDGRMTCLEFDKFYLINVYVPNSGKKEDLRKCWDSKFTDYIKSLDKPVIICGDLNVCSTELDYWGNYNKAINTSPGLMDFEISDFNKLCSNCNLVDPYRYLHNDKRKYSWYSTRNKNAVEKNQGWRLDYFLISESLLNHVINCDVLQGYQSPDHSPIVLDINI